MKRRDRFNEWNITEHVNFVNNFSTKLTAHAQPSYNEKPQEREGTIVVGNTCVQCKNSQVNCVLKVRHITLCLLSNEWQLVCTHERIAWIVYWNFDSKKLSEHYFVCMPWARAYVFVFIHSMNISRMSIFHLTTYSTVESQKWQVRVKKLREHIEERETQQNNMLSNDYF